MRFLQGPRASGAAVECRRDCTWSARAATQRRRTGGPCFRGGARPGRRTRVRSGRRDYNAGLECNGRATR
ncbi:hypothetical protein FCJ57_33820 [Burkholderia diffusa]|nr:hypothetical protein [Burkholderia diffusa]